MHVPGVMGRTMTAPNEPVNRGQNTGGQLAAIRSAVVPTRRLFPARRRGAMCGRGGHDEPVPEFRERDPAV
jgi:hypothetical protein